MRLPDVAIFHDSQSRNAAPPQWSALSTRGRSRTRLPSPSGTTNIMAPMPVATPNRQGRPLRTPACAPAAVSMMLLGPGVTAATTAKRRNATICSVVVRYPPRIGRPPGASREAASDARSEEHTSELQSLAYLVCRLLLEKKKKKTNILEHDYTC